MTSTTYPRRGFFRALLRAPRKIALTGPLGSHAGLRAARRAVLDGAAWQRCQFHLAWNAIHHAPNAEIRKRIGAELRAVCERKQAHQGRSQTGRQLPRHRAEAAFARVSLPVATEPNGNPNHQ